MTDARCKELILAKGVSLNPMSGVEGSYYTDNREEDLKRMVDVILFERLLSILNGV